MLAILSSPITEGIVSFHREYFRLLIHRLRFCEKLLSIYSLSRVDALFYSLT